MPSTDPARELFRHTLATLAYRGGKAIHSAPTSFADFNDSGKTPAQILAHIGDLLDWGLSMAKGKQVWQDSKPLPWMKESERFFDSLRQFDEYLSSPDPLHAPLEKLFQGPIADALTHVGQIAMLRRVAGAAMKGENYFVAEIVVGRVGPDQASPKRQF